jgi:hypothetical protein
MLFSDILVSKALSSCSNMSRLLLLWQDIKNIKTGTIKTTNRKLLLELVNIDNFISNDKFFKLLKKVDG